MRMQIAWFLLFTFNALCSSALAALAGTQWNQSDPQTKLMILIGIFASWTNTIMALFSKAMGRVKEGDDPFIDDDPDQVTTKKTVAASVTTVETKTESITPPSDPKP